MGPLVLLWLSFTRKQSLGTYSHADSTEEKGSFDPDGRFMPNYAFRRAKCETKLKKNPSIALANGEKWYGE